MQIWGQKLCFDLLTVACNWSNGLEKGDERCRPKKKKKKNNSKGSVMTGKQGPPGYSSDSMFTSRSLGDSAKPRSSIKNGTSY